MSDKQEILKKVGYPVAMVATTMMQQGISKAVLNMDDDKEILIELDCFAVFEKVFPAFQLPLFSGSIMELVGGVDDETLYSLYWETVYLIANKSKIDISNEPDDAFWRTAYEDGVRPVEALKSFKRGA